MIGRNRYPKTWEGWRKDLPQHPGSAILNA